MSVLALQIEITQGNVSALPIAITPFVDQVGDQTTMPSIDRIVAADLKRSGLFAPVTQMPTVPSWGEPIPFAAWRAAGADYLLIGRVQTGDPGRYRVQYRLFDVVRSKQIVAYSQPVATNKLRAAAHRIADQVYEALTGKPGFFSTRMAYVTSTPMATGRLLHQIKVADADGYRPRTIIASPEPLMSPAWSPDGQRLAYVAFERGRSALWVQDVETGERDKVAAFRGINGAPAWSPDGKKIALTLSKAGNPDIYILDLATKQLRPLTQHAGIDTEPAWSPDGQWMVFTSNRGGSAQLYRMPVTGGRAQRLTFEGNYNASAAYAPDGRQIALVTREQGRYRIGLLNLQSKSLRLLSNGTLDESPGFAPNGSMVIYATRARGQDVLAMVSVDGTFRQRIGLETQDVREPAWSPR